MKKLTTASGIPYFENENSMTIGERGPILLQDVYLHEKLAHFNRERIPERIVHAKGTGAYGTFKVTNDNECKIFIRFSVVTGEKGGSDTVRDPRGFAIKFYTEDGNWDLVGNNTPVFFIKDPKKFPEFVHSQKKDPRTNLTNPTSIWDFFSLNPESLHQVIFLFGDRGTPKGYRTMEGFASHTFSMFNAKNEKVWVKYHFAPELEITNFTSKESAMTNSKDLDYAQRDLVEAIDRGEFPKWKLNIQVMSLEQAKTFKWNPFDVTKVWSHKEFPLIEAGVMELNKIPENYFAEVEQVAFAPAHIVDGLGYSPDKLLQGRLLAYPDAQRYRLGVNYEQIPVNRPVCPMNNHQRDGRMNIEGNSGSSTNYQPNSFDNIEADVNYKIQPMKLDSEIADYYDRNANDDDHYSQPAMLFTKVMNDKQRVDMIDNIVQSMSEITGSKKDEIIKRQLEHFYKMDKEFAKRIAESLKIEIDYK
ncbi:MAG: catalase [Candidatus Kapabacteria bacterium]|nr:catalase [Candidatus Kapabacteria bacterium]